MARLLLNHLRWGPGTQFWCAGGCFLLLAVFHTWPLATGTVSPTHDDVWLNAWAVAWIAHQIPRNPLQLFDANMFFPHQGTLVYTEPLIIPGLMAAPILWLGGSPLLAHMVLVLLGYTLTALGMYVLVRKWTGDFRAGLLSGALFAFCTELLMRTAHVQGLHIYWLPLAFLAFQRLMARRRPQDAAWLGLCVIGAALTSGYLVVFVCFALGAAALARVTAFREREGARLLLQLGVAAAGTVAILLAVLWPYVQAGHERPPVAEAADLATALGSYLASGAVFHQGWSADYAQSSPRTLFPGVVMLVLATAAACQRRRVAPLGARRMLLATAAAGFLLSLGSFTPVYTWAYELVPPLRGLRAVSRFGILPLFALAALAGIGLSGLRWPASRPRRSLVAVVLLLLATGESFHGWGSDPWRDTAGRIHRFLATSSWPGAVLELPIYQRRYGFHRNARYLLASTVHWRPLVNGFGGFAPSDFDDNAHVASGFPSVLTVKWLQEIGVGYVLIDLDHYGNRMRRKLNELDKRRDLALEAVDGATRLYRVLPDTPRAIEALAPVPNLSQLRIAGGPAEGSMLRAAHGLRQAFGFQSPQRFVAYLESTRADSQLVLRFPAPMSGRFFDAATGEALQEVTVRASAATDPPASLYPPAGHAGLLLDLRPQTYEP
ncbi:MAG: hypothetical protein F4Z04_04035 [Acidobacteria bacterium]|nr:hypothetical protein [Acidobacteriota bacterium]